MSKGDELPFERGQTALAGLVDHNGNPIVDTTVLQNLAGREYLVEDVDPSTGIARTNRMVKLRLVRNNAPFNLLPKRLVQFDNVTAGNFGSAVIGYNSLAAQEAYPVDEYLPAAGVANGDLFYIVVEGPALVLTALDAGADNVIGLGTLLVSIAAATTGATTAGRVGPQDLTGATGPLGNNIQNRVGYALTAATTSNTNATILADVGHW